MAIDRGKLEETILAPKKVATDSGTVEERSISDLQKGVKMLEDLEAKETKRPKLARLGIYGRINL